MFSAHTIHLLHLFVRSLFIALIILLAALFFGLIYGIQIDKLDIGKYRIDGLYIKLDKKLTLKAKEITIPKSKAAPSFERVDRTFDQIKYLLTFFDTIMLERVNFKNNHLTLLYADDVLYITSDQYEIAGNIERRGSRLIADVALLYLKQTKVTLSGKLTYDLHDSALETGGKFEAFGIKGHFRAVKRGKEIIYAVNTRPFSSLEPLFAHIDLNKEIEAWITKKVRAKTYRVEYLKGRVGIENGKMDFDFANLKGKVDFDDVTIDFNEALAPVKAEKMALTYNRGNLYFTLDTPTYKGRDINGSSVSIKHLVGPMLPVLVLDLKVKSQVDNVVQDILKAYKLKIPVYHSGKKNRMSIKLKIPLVKGKQQITAEVDAVLAEGVLDIDTFKLHVLGGRVHYGKGSVILKGVHVKEKWFDGMVSGRIFVVEERAKLMLDAKNLSLGDGKSTFLVIKKKKLPLELQYGRQLEIELPSLAVKVVKKKQQINVTMKDLGKIAPFLIHNVLDIKGGELKIASSDMVHYRFKGMIRKDDCIFYGKQQMCYTMIPLEGTYNAQKKSLNFYAFEKRLHVDLGKGHIVIKNINVDLKRLIAEILRLKKKEGTHSPLDRKLVIVGKKSHIRYDAYLLVTDSYDIEISPKGNIKAYGSIAGDVVKFTKTGEHFTLQALRVTDKMLHPLINFTGLKNGRYSLKKEGILGKKMKGRIIIEGGVLSDFKAYNNTLAFVNTVPALATMKNPGFSLKGFKIKEGVIEYTMTPEKITFTSVYLKGNSATVVGKGEIDLKTKRLNIDLAILTVRELGKVVGKVPLLGYILMGDDKSMTVGLKITGTLTDPKVNTSVAKDILTLPLQILKRTITAPAHMGRQKAPTDIPPKEGTQQKKLRSKPASIRDPNLPIPSMSSHPEVRKGEKVKPVSPPSEGQAGALF